MKNAAGASSVVYGLGLIGALVYYVQHATSIWTGLLGVLYSLFWPAFLVYRLLVFLNM